MEELDKIPFKISEEARQVLGLPYLKDKAICFISTWERTRVTSYMPTEEYEKEYSFQESRLFEKAKYLFQTEGDFSFIAFRELNNDSDLSTEEILEAEELEEKLPKIEELFKPNNKNISPEEKLKENWKKLEEYKNARIKLKNSFLRKSLAYFHHDKKLNDLVGHDISILPDDIDYVNTLKESENLWDLHRINILCIDYSHFPHFVLNHFLQYMDAGKDRDGLEVSDDLKPLYNLFKQVSEDITLITHDWLKIWIHKAYRASLSVRDWDEIEFLSVNHLQNTALPEFWNKIKKNGYLCKGNMPTDSIEGINSEADVRIFYSFESLLFFELRNCLKRIKRCENCHSIIGIENQRYKGKYCQKGSENYRKCFSERNRHRQKKHYDLTKS